MSKKVKRKLLLEEYFNGDDDWDRNAYFVRLYTEEGNRYAVESGITHGPNGEMRLSGHASTDWDRVYSKYSALCTCLKERLQRRLLRQSVLEAIGRASEKRIAAVKAARAANDNAKRKPSKRKKKVA